MILSAPSPCKLGAACGSSLWRLAIVLLFVAALIPLAARAQYNGPPTAADHGIPASVTTDQTTLFPTTPEPALAAGDQINVRLYGETDYTFSGRISEDGTVLLPLIGLVTLQGQTITQAELTIAHDLQDAGMYRNPQVILNLEAGSTNATITLSGEMHAVVPVVGSRTLYAAIAAGGGLPNSASRTVTVLRRGQSSPVVVDIGNDPLHSAAGNIPLFPGDTVIVSRIGLVYVTGEFRAPTTVPLTNYGPLTLSQVSAVVGGPVWTAEYGKLHIIRTAGDHRTVTTLDLKKVLYGKAPDPIMQPNDIVFLPPSPWKSSLQNGSVGSILGVISFALATIYTIH